MMYGTGGLAVGHVEHTFTEVLAPGTTCVTPGLLCRTISDSTVKFGWTIGGGFEWHMGYGWIVGAEYLFVDLGRSTLQLAPVPGATFGFTNTGTATFDDRSHIGRARLSYKFQGPTLVPGH
jgi:outer membrane immunogenic protein